MGVGKNNRLKLMEHNNEKKSRLVAINARRFGRRNIKVHAKRILEFS